MDLKPFFRFRDEPRDFSPKIWRTFQVSNNVSMAKLGYIIMAMFEMKGNHLFCLNLAFEGSFRVDIRENYFNDQYIWFSHMILVTVGKLTSPFKKLLLTKNCQPENFQELLG